MDRPLREHISFLERRIRELNSSLMEESRTLAERNGFEAEIRAAELALAHYRAALELEKKLTT